MTNREQLLKYRGNKCSGCGLSVPEMVSRYGTFNRMIEFHHVDPKTKSNNYDNLIRRKISTEQIEEAEKCILLCSQCHGILHAQCITGKMELNMEFEGRSVTQRLEGHIIYDAIDNTLKFLTNQRMMLQVYRIRVSGKDEEILSGVEIAEDRYFTRIFEQLAIGQAVEVYNYRGTKLDMRAESIGNREIKMTHAIGFPFFTMDLRNMKSETPDI